MTPFQYIDSRSFPRCMVGNRPRPARRTDPKPTPASHGERPPFDGIAALRETYAAAPRAVNRFFWQRSQPALASPMRPRRETRLDHPEEMTVAQLASTQEMELPSISSEAYDELGTKALSLNASAKFDDEPDEGTIAERIPAEVRERLALLAADGTPVEPEALTPEQLDALRERFAAKYGVALDIPSPQIRQRIEWERYVASCSGITRHEGFRILPNDVRFFSFGVVERRDFARRKAEYVREFLARIGRTAFPSPAEFAQRRNVLRTLARQHRWRAEAERLDAEFAALDAERQWLIEREGAMSWDETEYDYTPSYALLREQAWRALKPKGWVAPAEYAALRKQSRETAYTRWQQMREAAEVQTVHRCRNPRTHHSRDEMWHSVPRDPDEFELGFDWTYLPA